MPVGRIRRPSHADTLIGSFVTSGWPSRSAKSASSESCAAAVVLTELEIMQPSITPRPQARAAWIMRSVSRTPPALSSFTFTP